MKTPASNPPGPRPAPAGGSFWFTTGDPGPVRSPISGTRQADVAVIGGGFTGLWTAIALLETDPTLTVVVLEAERVGWGASGRNGGFCEASWSAVLIAGRVCAPALPGLTLPASPRVAARGRALPVAATRAR
jgi:FAD dependent oxidoreductase